MWPHCSRAHKLFVDGQKELKKNRTHLNARCLYAFNNTEREYMDQPKTYIYTHDVISHMMRENITGSKDVCADQCFVPKAIRFWFWSPKRYGGIYYYMYKYSSLFLLVLYYIYTYEKRIRLFA